VKKEENQTTVAAFDFDGTLTHHDTLVPFISFLNGPAETMGSIVLALPNLFACLFNNRYRQIAKEAILKTNISGMTDEALRKQGESFALGPLQNKIRPEGLKKLQWHKQQGHRCILISANLDVYLEPWAMNAGFHDLICSKLEVDKNGKFTGKLIGLNCWGPEKSRRLLQLLGPKENYKLYVYGDSRGDRDLLELADYPFYRRFT